ncbi:MULTISPECIES: hypothetical protein [Pseudomonas]|uniref:hypothetical protein n=1 Tax=Pseudomonas TaxID=286 RepID=UPI0015E46E9A|nr:MULTISPECIES: hypothetical protein [Pseudomonas]MBA1300088.1 hypothetical protein [Pseudomonas carnis]MBJ2202968.1 hypothetical protein [Pseudomonas carnis]MBW9243989.1 hypothetical protein [Pseudomonas paracarnis]ULN82669.1 hypothetical protein HXW87_10945 [Pseudomonas sp. Y5-11]
MKAITTPKGNIKIIENTKEKQKERDLKQLHEYEELQKKAKEWIENLIRQGEK